MFFVIPSVLFFLSNVLLEICRWRKVTWQFWILSAGWSNWPSQPINFLLPSQTASIAPSPVHRPYNVFPEEKHEREGKRTPITENFSWSTHEAACKIHEFRCWYTTCCLLWEIFTVLEVGFHSLVFWNLHGLIYFLPVVSGQVEIRRWYFNLQSTNSHKWF